MEKLLLIAFAVIALPTIIFCVYLQFRVSDEVRSSDHRMGAEAHLMSIPINPR
jgi:cell division protein FtsL